MLIDFKENLNCDDFSFLIDLTQHSFLDEFEIKAFGHLVDAYKINDDKLLDYFREETEVFLREELDSTKSDIDLSKYVKGFAAYDGFWGPQQDERGVEDELYDTICEIINDMGSDTIDNLDIDIDSLVNEIDINKMFQNYYESQSSYDDKTIFSKSIPSLDQDIDDLFERT